VKGFRSELERARGAAEDRRPAIVAKLNAGINEVLRQPEDGRAPARHE